MRYTWSIGHRLPAFLASPLFGDRRQFGTKIIEDDPDWQEWQSFYLKFYQNTQKQGPGKIINDAGYKILQQINLAEKRVLEIGPGALPHVDFMQGIPGDYIIIDVKQSFLDTSTQVLQAKDIPVTPYLSTSHKLPAADNTIDTVLSFYSLEHLNPLDIYLEEMRRVLVPGGLLVGAIPAEGGIAWGAGRLLTSRRYVKQNSAINPDKIICWEHPNFAETIFRTLNCLFNPVSVNFWPLKIPSIDLNLILSFIYQKTGNNSFAV